MITRVVHLLMLEPLHETRSEVVKLVSKVSDPHQHLGLSGQ